MGSGEGSDVVDGRSGSDVMVFNGSNGDERFEALPNGRLVRFTRDAGNIVMDLDNIEQIDLDAFDGRDTLVVRDMAGTDLDVLNTDLENAAGSGTGDALTDFITVFGTDGDDDVTVSGAAGTATVTGLTTTVNITAVLPDVMQVLGHTGNDTIDASGLAADAIGYGTSGSDGNDTLRGGAGADSLDGGNGNDFVDGGRGDDSVFTGPGDDVFQWDPGEGSDLFGGEDGHDTMLFNGSDQNEAFATFADGFGGATFTRDVGSITMSLDRVEQIDLAARGGADTLFVDDLNHFRGTGIEAINSDLGSDGLTDIVTVTGSESDDVIGVTGAPGTANVTGLAATVGITGLEPDRPARREQSRRQRHDRRDPVAGGDPVAPSERRYRRRHPPRERRRRRPRRRCRRRRPHRRSRRRRVAERRSRQRRLARLECVPLYG